MSTLLRRGAGLVKGGLRALLEPAEDPRVVFASTQQRQRELLAQARQALDVMVATRGQLEVRRRAIQGHMARMEAQARQALAAGREDLARMALRRRHIAAAELRALDQNIQEIQAREQVLALHEERLAAQAEAFEARVKLIAASHSAAEAQLRMNEAFSGVSTEMSDLSMALTQTERQTEGLRARAAELESLAGALPRTGEGLEQLLAPIADDAQIEAELAALKATLEDRE